MTARRDVYFDMLTARWVAAEAWVDDAVYWYRVIGAYATRDEARAA